MNGPQIIVVGGGAAGFFAAIAAAEAGARVTVLERGSQCLTKVRISGGGRCNVTHSCFDPGEFTLRYPRGQRELIGPLHRFQAGDTVAWFESRGVRLKSEADGRMFPVTDNSQTIIDCLTREARKAGVQLKLNAAVERIVPPDKGGFVVELENEGALHCDKVLLATGGCRSAGMGHLAVSVGHTLEPPVPSLFTLKIDLKWLRELAGVTVEPVEITVPETRLKERGPVLMTHWGMSGPAILRLSAWGARKLNELAYRFPLNVNWLPDRSREELFTELQVRRKEHGARLVVNSPIAPLTARLWEALVLASGIGREDRWSGLKRDQHQRLAEQLTATRFNVTGKSLNKEEFVTCGGVRLKEVNFKTMESRLCPGLFFAGELLDIDGITGGFNFQSAWTTGWIAGNAMASH